MSKVILGLLAGIVFGALDVGLMLPMSFPDKTTALLSAFASRFAIGFVIGCVQLPAWPGWVVGLLVGLPDAIITHKYVPILVLGGIGGLVIGGVIHGWKETSNQTMKLTATAVHFGDAVSVATFLLSWTRFSPVAVDLSFYS